MYLYIHDVPTSSNVRCIIFISILLLWIFEIEYKYVIVYGIEGLFNISLRYVIFSSIQCSMTP